MTASERFANYLKGKPVDRLPCIEWAPWWHLTVNRWHTEGLPAERESVGSIQEFFGLDQCLQSGMSVENYRIYVRLLKEYAAKVDHAQQEITPCPVFAG